MMHQLYGLVQVPVSTSRAGKVGSSDRQNLCFRFAPSARELWDAVIDEDFLGSGHTRTSLQKLGWRAVPVIAIVGD